MDEQTYAELVIGKLHSRTLQGKVKWKIDRDYLVAEPIPSIRLRITFKDKGPGSAEWERVSITHPVGDGVTSVINPSAPLARYGEAVTKETFDKLNQLFDLLLLTPRVKQFEAALAELAQQ